MRLASAPQVLPKQIRQPLRLVPRKNIVSHSDAPEVRTLQPPRGFRSRPRSSLMVVFGARRGAVRPSVEGLGRMTRVTARRPCGVDLVTTCRPPGSAGV